MFATNSDFTLEALRASSRLLASSRLCSSSSDVLRAAVSSSDVEYPLSFTIISSKAFERSPTSSLERGRSLT
jgi:hypothetical protein